MPDAIRSDVDWQIVRSKLVWVISDPDNQPSQIGWLVAVVALLLLNKQEGSR